MFQKMLYMFCNTHYNNPEHKWNNLYISEHVLHILEHTWYNSEHTLNELEHTLVNLEQALKSLEHKLNISRSKKMCLCSKFRIVLI